MTVTSTRPASDKALVPVNSELAIVDVSDLEYPGCINDLTVRVVLENVKVDRIKMRTSWIVVVFRPWKI